MLTSGARAEPWATRLRDPVLGFASGWLGIRARARQRGVELPLAISDHADWPELLATLRELRPAEVWVTHGRAEALVRQAALDGLHAHALEPVGRGDEDAR